MFAYICVLHSRTVICVIICNVIFEYEQSTHENETESNFEHAIEMRLCQLKSVFYVFVVRPNSDQFAWFLYFVFFVMILK